MGSAGHTEGGGGLDLDAFERVVDHQTRGNLVDGERLEHELEGREVLEPAEDRRDRGEVDEEACELRRERRVSADDLGVAIRSK